MRTIRSAVPESLRQIIEQQLHHVRPEDQVLLEAASITGRTFSAAAVAAAVNQATEDIEARLAVLAHHGQFIQACGLMEWPDGTVAAAYRFLHDLYCETLSDRYRQADSSAGTCRSGPGKRRAMGHRRKRSRPSWRCTLSRDETLTALSGISSTRRTMPCAALPMPTPSHT